VIGISLVSPDELGQTSEIRIKGTFRENASEGLRFIKGTA
jgi:hypothetical protein